MDGYLRRQLANQRRGTPLQARPSERLLYAQCDPDAARATDSGACALTRVRHLASQGPCWEGYHRDYSKAKYADDSCVKDGKKPKKDKKAKKEKAPKKEGEAASDSPSSSEDEASEKPAKKKAKKESD